MLTPEHQAVVDAPLRGVLKVKAFAGTGKTTCLVHKAQRHAAEDGCKGLYVAFNKSAQTEAQARFGSAALCKTGHSLAFPGFGKRYKHKLRSMKPLEVYPSAVWSINMPSLFDLSTIVIFAVLGVCVGSFLNVVIYRLPLMMEREAIAECQGLCAEDVFARSPAPRIQSGGARFGLSPLRSPNCA